MPSGKPQCQKKIPEWEVSKVERESLEPYAPHRVKKYKLCFAKLEKVVAL
jgi:hypothetical protein